MAAVFAGIGKLKMTCGVKLNSRYVDFEAEVKYSIVNAQKKRKM